MNFQNYQDSDVYYHDQNLIQENEQKNLFLKTFQKLLMKIQQKNNDNINWINEMMIKRLKDLDFNLDNERILLGNLEDLNRRTYFSFIDYSNH